MDIKDFLDLDDTEIKRRMEGVEKDIPTHPGIAYIKTRLKEFDVQPWPFLTYLAYYRPVPLTKMFERYGSYDGAQNAARIREKLKEKYILEQVLEKLEQEKK